MGARVVVGANYGDEGKGRIVDWLCSPERQEEFEEFRPTSVVRYCGGANAGHTVVRNKKRVVFSSIGSGTLNGLPTFWDGDFIVNPMLVLKEIRELERAGVDVPAIGSVPHLRVTTPWDMLINQMIERKRGSSRHGSTGAGIGETVERNLNFYDFSVANLSDAESVARAIREEWVPRRLRELDLHASDDERLWEFIHSDQIAESFLTDCSILDSMLLKTFTNPWCPSSETDCILEGSQGLAIDEKYWKESDPHTTWASVGAGCASKKTNYEIDEVIYVTRSFLTRHGAGPLPEEDKFDIARDLTNVENEWQGKLRFAYFSESSIIDMAERIKADRQEVRDYDSVCLAVTHLDVVDTFYEDDSEFDDQPVTEVMSEVISEVSGIRVGYTSDRSSYHLEEI